MRLPRVAEVRTQIAALPIPNAPWGDAIHHVTHIELVIVDVLTDTGIEGVGFTHTSGVGAAAIEALITDDVASFVAGREVSPRGLWHDTWHHLHDMGGGGVTTMALAALDIAYWDIVGKSVQLPLADLLGRCRDRVPVYRSGTNLDKPLDELLDQVEGWVAAGYRGVKVKVGRPDIEEDVERVTRVRALAGRLPLMVDANQGWDAGKAIRAIRALEGLDLAWVEEPLLSDDVAGHARLRERVAVPIALGENVYTPFQFAQYVAAGAVDYLQADVGRVGGITPFLDIAALARAWNLPMAPHFMVEISGQLLCSIPNAKVCEDLDGGSLSDLGVLAEPVPVQDGHLAPPASPGHGIVLDRDRLAAHRRTPTARSGG